MGVGPSGGSHSRGPRSRRRPALRRSRQPSYASVVTPFAKFDEHVRAHAREYVDELKELIRLPTVSAHKRAIDETASAVLARAKRAGVVAEALRANGGPPTNVGGAGGGLRAPPLFDPQQVEP